jgi:hypothetical protein
VFEEAANNAQRNVGRQWRNKLAGDVAGLLFERIDVFAPRRLQIRVNCGTGRKGRAKYKSGH